MSVLSRLSKAARALGKSCRRYDRNPLTLPKGAVERFARFQERGFKSSIDSRRQGASCHLPGIGLKAGQTNGKFPGEAHEQRRRPEDSNEIPGIACNERD